MSRCSTIGWAIAFGVIVATCSSEATAHPQISVSTTQGLALTDFRADNGPRLAYHLGGKFEALFLRDKPRDMAFGFYADVATEAFDTFEVGGGLSWLVPTQATAFVFSAGGLARTSSFGWEPGLSTTIFWGSKSFNFHSVYCVGAGLFAQGRYGLGDGHQADAIAGVQIDLAYLALPAIFIYEAIRR